MIPAHQAGQAHRGAASSRSASCAAITPWNFPAAMITRKAGPALAAGCTIVCQARRADAVLGAGHGGARASAPASRRACSTSSPATPAEIGGEMTSQPDRAQAHLHRLDRGRQDADGAVRRHDQEAVAGTRRQRALHRVRRRGPRRRGRRAPSRRKYRNTGQTCVCANRLLRAGGRLRRVRRQAGRRGAASCKVGDGLEAARTQGR